MADRSRLNSGSNSPDRSRPASRDPDVVLMQGDAAPRGAAGTVPGLEILANLLDSAFRIPGLNIRVGLDALLGLIPGLGDVGTSLLSMAILTEAHRRGVSRVTMARMTANLAIDTAMGSIPLLGDAFDIYWKANNRNVELLKRATAIDARTRRQSAWGDRLFFAGLIAIVLACLATSVTVAFFALRWLFGLGSIR